jgi:hypothetical protein
MQRVVVNINNRENANLFVKIAEQMNFVKSVKIEEEEYDWLNPTRPATDEEAEKMIQESENSPSMSAEEAREYTLKLIKKNG